TVICWSLRQYLKPMPTFDPTTLEIYRALFTSVAEEMGIALRRTAFSPNIKERRDYSCAVFDADGWVIAQGDHMPVHLGSMPMAVAAALREVDPQPGDVVALNDPYAGGTHLPDVTLVAGVYANESDGGKGRRGEAEKGGKGERGKKYLRVPLSPRLRVPQSPRHPVSASNRPLFYVANRAHHADIGGATPGSMGLATDIYGEGLRIPPIRLVRGGKVDDDVMRLLLAKLRGHTERRGGFEAQIGSLHTGAGRFVEIVERRGERETREYARQLIDYSARIMRQAISNIPDGRYEAEDALDDDGVDNDPVPIHVRI